MCGEKLKFGTNVTKNPGSPPRVRGKGIVHVFVPEKLGITPAYAGKSRVAALRLTLHRDHPRVCGEKRPGGPVSGPVPGSPPRMRGKASRGGLILKDDGITPAYAGKSALRLTAKDPSGDHPRMCGEKSKIPSR